MKHLTHTPSVRSVTTHHPTHTHTVWQIPSIPTPVAASYFGDMEAAYRSCTLRIRYNISTSDFPAWPAEALEDGHPFRGLMVDHANNSVSTHHGHNDPSGETTPLLQDPYMAVGVGDDASLADQVVALAVNTNQYARTFQDRTYSFAIKKRPSQATPPNAQLDTPAVIGGEGMGGGADHRQPRSAATTDHDQYHRHRQFSHSHRSRVPAKPPPQRNPPPGPRHPCEC